MNLNFANKGAQFKIRSNSKVFVEVSNLSIDIKSFDALMSRMESFMRKSFDLLAYGSCWIYCDGAI